LIHEAIHLNKHLKRLFTAVSLVLMLTAVCGVNFNVSTQSETHQTRACTEKLFDEKLAVKSPSWQRRDATHYRVEQIEN
jgi:hypothetical protein